MSHIQHPLLLYFVEKAASSCILHGNTDVLTRQEDLLRATVTIHACAFIRHVQHICISDLATGISIIPPFILKRVY